MSCHRSVAILPQLFKMSGSLVILRFYDYAKHDGIRALCMQVNFIQYFQKLFFFHTYVMLTFMHNYKMFHKCDKLCKN